jgi:hypothetical protein
MSHNYPFYEIMVKGILGPSIGESGAKVGDLSGGSITQRLAASRGVIVDGGKFKCPPGTPGAGDFTDAMGSTCAMPSQNASGKKSLVQRVHLDEKVGSVRSNSKLGQGLQAIGTMLIPGDASDIRSPIRSTVYETLTPGGGRDRIGGPRRLFRCPPGFENGGQFTDSRLGTCGIQLFDVTDSAATAARSAANRVLRRGDSSDGLPNIGDAGRGRSGRLIRGQGISGNIVDIKRGVDPVGKASRVARDSAVSTAVPLVGKKPHGSVRLVRRDGSSIDSTVDISRLAKVRDNDDITDGVFLIATAKPDDFGTDGLDLFGTGAYGVAFSFADGSSVQINRKSKATPQFLNDLPANLKKIRKDLEGPDMGEALSQLADQNPDMLEIVPRIADLESRQAMEMIEIRSDKGASRMVRRWIYEMFLAPTAPARPKGVAAWEVIIDEDTPTEG